MDGVPAMFEHVGFGLHLADPFCQSGDAVVLHGHAVPYRIFLVLISARGYSQMLPNVEEALDLL